MEETTKNGGAVESAKANGPEGKAANGQGEVKTAADPIRSETTYPAYDLEEALRFAGAVHRAGGNESTEEDVMKEMGLASRTSRAWSYRLSSSREFGLVERAGRASEARIKVTELYRRIALPGSDTEKQFSMIQALQRPALYVKLLDKYIGGPVPDAQQVANVLVRDHKLLESVKLDAAQAFLASVKFAGFITPNNIIAAPGSGQGRTTAPTQAPSIVNEPTQPKEELAGNGEQLIRVPATFIAHVFQLRKNLKVTIPLPSDLSDRDVERLHIMMKANVLVDDEE